MTVLSSHNPVVQQLRRLVRRRSSRSEQGVFVVDGPVLVGEALASGASVRAAFVDVDAQPDIRCLADRLEGEGIPVHVLAPGVLRRVADTVTPHGIVAVVDRRPPSLAGALAAERPLVVVLAGVADPGNAGTLLRSAEAAGATAVVTTRGSVDVFAPKTVRASAGALFHVPVVPDVEAGELVDRLRAAGIRVAATAAAGGIPYDRADLTVPLAVVVGNEAHGLDDSWGDVADLWLTIPLVGRAESLNVAMAGTVVCFEAARQRRDGE